MHTARVKVVVQVLLLLGSAEALAAACAQDPPSSQQITEPRPDAQQRPSAPEQPAKRDRQAEAGSDLYGDPLPPHALARMGTVRLRHSGLISCLALSRDGKTLASIGASRRDSRWAIYLWDLTTGKEIRRLGWLKAPPGRVVFSPDGKRLASSSGHDGSVRLWDAETAKELHVMHHAERLGRQRGAYSVAFSADGKTLASAGADYTIRFWEVETGEEIRRWDVGKRSALCVAFLPDGKTLASIDANGPRDIVIWDLATGKELRALTGHQPLWSFAAALFTTGGNTLVSAGMDRTVRWWDVAEGKEIRQVSGVFRGASPDGKFLAIQGQTDVGKALAGAGRPVEGPLRAGNVIAASPRLAFATLPWSCVLSHRPDGGTRLHIRQEPRANTYRSAICHRVRRTNHATLPVMKLAHMV
jgi:WD40 repeat protein